MKTIFVLAVITSVFAAHYGFAAATLAASADACSEWGLTGKDLADCRTEWTTAKTEAERTAIRTKFGSKAPVAPPEILGTSTKAPLTMPDKSTNTDPLLKPNMPPTTGEHRMPKVVPPTP